jgi:eukaryotic-like serine/threonine-protein kinase
MSLPRGEHLGPYEIVEMIGKGGMGEVYRARDTRLHRDVAVKVASNRFNERFGREARAIAQLNHPNICTLFDVGPNFLVMELVGGETLAELMKAGPIPLAESLRIARQIADALDAAHEKGIVHRDLKPGNVKIKPDGTVKVLDFGLAKLGNTPTAPANDESPTITMAATQAGVILGTASYMAPEQAMGKPVDKRADIYAFGAVVFEMVTGKRLHRGSSVTEVLASVIKEEPKWEKVPSRVQKMLHQCLEKDPQKRLRHIGDVMLLVEEEPSPAASVQKSSGQRPWRWPAVALLLSAVAALGWWAPWRAAPKLEALRFQIQETNQFKLTEGANPSVSPDGRWVVFPATGTDGIARLWLRALDSLDAHPLERTESGNGIPPPAYWSPDSRFIVYGLTPGPFSPGKLMRQDISGGPPQVICDVLGAVSGAAWSTDGTILFADNTKRSLQRVSASGGDSSTAIELPTSDLRHLMPQFLPDGRRFLYFRATESSDTVGVYLGSLDLPPSEQSKKPVLFTNRQAYYSRVAGGQLVFLRDRTLFAQPFDADTAVLSGNPAPIADQVASFAPAWAGQFSISDTGVLAYNSGPANSSAQLWIVDRSGKRMQSVGDPGLQESSEFSPDGKRLAATRTDPANGTSNIWVTDLANGRSTKITYGTGRNDSPVWSPDGESIIFSSNRNGVMDLYLRKADGSGEERSVLKTPEDKHATSWIGNHLVFMTNSAQTGFDLWVLSNPEKGNSQAVPYLKTKFMEVAGRISPDGRWVAYTSNEAGQWEIYVRPFDAQRITESAASGRWLVSKGGGSDVRWRSDGKELFYLSPELRISSISVDAAKPYQTQGDSHTLTTPRPINEYASTGDGSRFASVEYGGDGGSKGQLTVVTNWHAALGK